MKLNGTRISRIGQASKSAVSRVSKPADRTTARAAPIGKSATQQVWKPALRSAESFNDSPIGHLFPPHPQSLSPTGEREESIHSKFKTQNSKFHHAFTLVEILVSLAIFTMLVAALYATWLLVVRATDVGKRTAAQLQRERITMSTIETALTCIQSHQASINYFLFDVGNGDQPYLSFTAYLPRSFPRSGEFFDNDPNGVPMDYHLRRVTFSLQEDADGQGKDLILRQNPILMDLTPEEKNNPLVLAKNVTDFLIECWDTNNMQWDTEWDATNIIPPLVRVTVGFSSDNVGGGQAITREVSFPATTMPSQVQTPNYNGTYTGGMNFYNNNNASGNPGGGPSGAPGNISPGGGPALP